MHIKISIFNTPRLGAEIEPPGQNAGSLKTAPKITAGRYISTAGDDNKKYNIHLR